ncbi:MAG: hypothetical protein GEU74_03265 [Nitriliruptorales bacterium]|nr:hypothetical protein [Nitriliruptorales bacterium]
MKRVLVIAVAMAFVLVGFAPAGMAAENQPGQGVTSTGRNEAGFGGGPHCHLLLSPGAQTQFEFIRVFPSHTGHDSSGVGHVFAADGDCDGLP